MKQIAVLSGKGGTGKTVITASLAALAKNKITVDCDVDAANLHILLKPDIRERHEFSGGKTAFIDKSICVECGLCRDICRFKAIQSDYQVDEIDCEGCGLCANACPEQAVSMKENISGEWFVSDTEFGPLVHAKLGIAEENSGKLVAAIRDAARNIAVKNKYEYIIIDGPPGIGCPTMSTLSGVDLALIVTEPSVSGIHDLQRVLEVTTQFNIPAKIIVNRYDINRENTDAIIDFGRAQNSEVLELIPYSPEVTRSVVNCVPLVEYTGGELREKITGLWERIRSEILVKSMK
jgi:MinD superfamily P-loop ATPase